MEILESLRAKAQREKVRSLGSFLEGHARKPVSSQEEQLRLHILPEWCSCPRVTEQNDNELKPVKGMPTEIVFFLKLS